jgi:hypothetical protein
VEADGFDFFGVADGGGSDLPGIGILENTKANSDAVALLLVALEAEVGFMVAQAFPGDFKAFVVLLAFKKFGGGIGAFGDVRGSGVLIIFFVHEFEKFAGSYGSNTARDAATGGLGEASGIFAEVFHGADVFFFIKPTPVTDFPPVAKVFKADRDASELSGKVLFDGGKFVKPSEDFPAFVAVVEAEIDFLAQVGGKAGNLADTGMEFFPLVRTVLNLFFVTHAGIFSQA